MLSIRQCKSNKNMGCRREMVINAYIISAVDFVEASFEDLVKAPLIKFMGSIEKQPLFAIQSPRST